MIKGKCHDRKSVIPLKYLIVGLLTCLFIVLMYLRHSMTQTFIFYSIFTCVLILAAFIDIEKLIVPDKLVIFLFFAGAINIIIHVISGGQIIDVAIHLTAAAAAGGFFYIIAFATKGKMGGGDIKLMAALGLCLGFRFILLTVFLCFLIGALVSITLIIAKTKSRTSQIAFVPFISIGAVVSMLYGNNIIDFYINAIL